MTENRSVASSILALGHQVLSPPSPTGRADTNARCAWRGQSRALQGARASGESLGPGAYWSPLRVEVAHHETTAAFDGTVRLARGLTIEGHLTAAGIDFRGVARAAGLPWAEFVQTGRATADLTVQFDTAAEDASPLFARGGIGLVDLWIAGPDPSAFIFGGAGVELTLEGFSQRGRRGAGGRPTRINVSNANVSAPFVLLTRPIRWVDRTPDRGAVGHIDPCCR